MTPLVSIVTPVYNGAEYLAECIQSVLAQSYKSWEYVIVNNCSQDSSLKIAQLYASKDSRIRVIDNPSFLDAIPNHNHALRQISPKSKYCKIVFADDWLFPECVERMVGLAEANPSVGLVCSYATAGSKVLWDGLPCSRTVVPGQEFCRWALLGGPYVLGTPTSQLIRSDVVRKRAEFYDASNLHADYEACFEVLQHSDLGFVHQVLSYMRTRPGSANDRATRLDSHMLGTLTVLLKFGPFFLAADEFALRLRQRWTQYYTMLAKCAYCVRGHEFWQYHANRLAKLGCPLSKYLLIRAMIRVAAYQLLHPQETLQAIFGFRRASSSSKVNPASVLEGFL
jgi:glycosyltransferase involved in cell wall biosynthesis